jgi:hypothetical protein
LVNRRRKQLAAWRLDEDIGEYDWVNSKQETFIHGAKLAVKYVHLSITLPLKPQS